MREILYYRPISQMRRLTCSRSRSLVNILIAEALKTPCKPDPLLPPSLCSLFFFFFSTFPPYTEQKGPQCGLQVQILILTS